MNKYLVFLFLLLANLFWAGNYVFGEYVVAEVHPLQITFTRWFLALILLLPLAHYIERPNWSTVWKEWKVLLLMAILGIIGYNFLLYAALQFTSPMNASLVNAINPAVIVLFSTVLLKERISKKNGLGLIVSLFGVVLILTEGNLSQLLHLNFNLGDLIMLLAIISWTLYSIMNKKLKRIPPITGTTVSVMIALVLLLPFMFMHGYTVPEKNLTLAGLIYMGIFPSVGSFIFWNIALRHIDASRAGVFMNLIVVFTAIISLLLGKTITLIQLVGGFLIFTGVYLTSLARKGKKERTALLNEKKHSIAK
ncbi:DMT family transporter [Sutcliffiella sp. NC1]|uniref:DMT family transporter n=1 Tax=Sutcliffiella sp. NC1 TaxID=3004096 RepID=UPI0022DE78EC|nr:DMT family transporter [Sutcliffiella sp. NC1]WBL15020.1 DMT family transporter [Sutcliffiella sp. NC1]